ncbi:MAG: NACHT domain-containing protein [Bacteroidota bacterium]
MSSEDLENTEILSIDEAISKSSRLLLRGPAGSGKTTLIQWIAVMAASNNLRRELEDWNSCIPFFIRLREFSDKKLPTPKDFPSLISPTLADVIPAEWVTKKLKSKQAIILVDGIDEVAEGQRKDIKNWIKDIDGVFPGNKWVITSRPYAVEKGWLSSSNFIDADLQDMNNKDIELFINHWHKAVLESENQSEKINEIRKLETKLQSTLKENRNIKKLATSPLLCAMICALHRDRSTQLPSDRIELYESCINMFLRRDIERNVNLDDYTEIGDRQKRVLLADFAYWLIKNGWSEVALEKADQRFDMKIKNLRDIPETISGAGIRRYFTERSGVLRQPNILSIDFPHRTFEEYLAAKAVVEGSDFGLLVKSATDDQWREVIQLTCGMARPKEANEIILDIIRLGDADKENRIQLHLLALACLDTPIEITSVTKKEVKKRLESLVPPSNIEAANQLAKAGEIVIPFLKYERTKKGNELAASVRTLARIGGDKALEQLQHYCLDKRKSVQSALVEGIKYCDDPSIYAEKIKSTKTILKVNSNTPFEVLKLLPNLENLHIYNKYSYDLKSILECRKLKVLTISESHININFSLKSLNSLVDISIHDSIIGNYNFTQIGDDPELIITEQVGEPLSFLEELTNLKRLSITGQNLSKPYRNRFQPAVDISKFLSNLRQLTHLRIEGDLIEDIDPLTSLKRLESLELKSDKLLDLEPITLLNSLNRLVIKGKNITNLNPLANLVKLEILAVASDKLSDLQPIINLKKLSQLSITGQGLVDLKPVGDVRSITSLKVDCKATSDFTFLSNMTELTSLEINATHVQDISFLTPLKWLTSLDIFLDKPSTLTPIYNLTNLKTLRLTGRINGNLKRLHLLKHLKTLDISPSFSQKKDITFLKKKLKGLTIRYVYNTKFLIEL